MKAYSRLFVALAVSICLQGCLSLHRNRIQFSDMMAPVGPAALTVAELEGEAEVRQGDDGSWTILSAGAAVAGGSQVRTRRNSKLVLAVASNGSRLTINPDSRIEIRSVEAPIEGDPTAVVVRVRVLSGGIGGSLQSGQFPSTFEITTADNNTFVYSPAAGQMMSLSFAGGGPPQLQQPFLNLAAPGTVMVHPNLTFTLQQIPEPGSASLLVFSAPLFWRRRPRRQV